MVLASVSYYWALEWFEGISSGGRGALVWALAGLVAGPAFGAAGWWCRAKPQQRWLALAPLAGVLLGEGLHLVRYVGVDDLWPAGAVELVAGAAVATACLLRARRSVVVAGLVSASFGAYFVAQHLIGAGFLA